jgi:hypothetical protein
MSDNQGWTGPPGHREKSRWAARIGTENIRCALPKWLDIIIIVVIPTAAVPYFYVNKYTVPFNAKTSSQ